MINNYMSVILQYVEIFWKEIQIIGCDEKWSFLDVDYSIDQ